MTLFESVLVVLAAIIPVFISLPFVARNFAWKDTWGAGARTILWSFSALSIISMLGLFSGIPVALVGILILAATILWAFAEKKTVFTRKFTWHAMAIVIPILFLTMLFAIPFFTIHDGLPTGDVQKSILWAQESLATNHLPDYERAISLLNRDPVDFYTPGLHSLTALVMAFSPAPLTSIGIFAILSAVCVGWITAAIAKEVSPKILPILFPILAGILTLTQYRFLRYLREPGYHFQNLIGELFLFGMIYLAIRFLRTREKQDAVLFIVCGSALFFSHQFSAFIGFFAIGFMTIAFLAIKRNHITRAIRTYKTIAMALAATIAITLVFGYSLGLAQKLPAIFTATPHLASLLPNIGDYPLTMGAAWFFAGVSGMILLLLQRKYLFVASALAILLLSQGPAIGIDIPPVRALFYLAVPFSVSAAYAIAALFSAIRQEYKGTVRTLALGLLTVALIFGIGSAPYRSYASLSHAVRTNSTLTAEQLYLIEQLKSYEDGAILIDDYNRRSASWLVLSGKPMVTRIAADLRQQMAESIQSPLRRQLYEKQLDYEKIIELGSLPMIANIAAQNNISYITGIDGSSNSAFEHNTVLTAQERAQDITIYSVDSSRSMPCNAECEFLMKRSTLANDIGDEMDTHEHLQASVRSSRLSDPKVIGNTTYRTTNAPVIPLKFNVGDYVRVLWKNEEIDLMLFFTRPITGLAISGSGEDRIGLPAQSHSIVRIPPELLHIDEKGFITLFIQNPNEQEIPINLIALGAAL